MADSDGRSQGECAHPADGDGLVRVGERLPSPGLEWVADGKVALQGDGHESEATGRHRNTWERIENDRTVG